MNLLEINNLKVWDATTGKTIIQDSAFSLKEGSCLAIIGESGSGKSVTCRAIMRLNRAWLQQSGEITFRGTDLNRLSEKEMRRLRGKRISLIMQNGMRAFDPSCVIGVHIKEVLSEHFSWHARQVEEKITQAMEAVKLKQPLELLNKYPHQLSGGMLQRIMIALALVLEPDILIADEPTTALDTISQYEVVEQLMKLRQSMGCAMIFISHDLGVVKRIADEVLVMKDGVIVEQGDIRSTFSYPQHDYTKYLVSTRQALSNNFKQVMGEGYGVKG